MARGRAKERRRLLPGAVEVRAGRIGAAAFAELFAHPATAGLPVIVETPTESHEGHAADIALLKGDLKGLAH